jgi:predicted AAA+ superfamily ATPase
LQKLDSKESFSYYIGIEDKRGEKMPSDNFNEELKSRPNYVKTLLEYKDTKIIKILTGVRRSGKSAVLSLFKNKLLSLNVSPKQIIYVNFESMKFADITNHKKLYEYVKRNIIKNKKAYLFFDEIQTVRQWEKAVSSFLVDFNADIYITGSNAYLLSSELSTLISGRYVEIKILPLSFKEFLSFYSFDAKLTDEDKFNLYLKYGGMPSIAEFNFNDRRVFETLEGIYNTVIVKDILQRNKITESGLLKRLAEFLAQNIGSINSVNSISNYLVSDKSIEHNAKYPNKIIDAYITAFENAFIFYGVKRYDIKGKELLKTLTKNYIVDIGLRNMLLGFRDADRGFVLENIVYFELLRRGYKINIGKWGNIEVDFAAQNQKEKIYFQISESLLDKKTLEREIKPLKEINDNYRKIILSLDKHFAETIDGIEVKNIIDWLLE